jgi:hypothetical protein
MEWIQGIVILASIFMGSFLGVFIPSLIITLLFRKRMLDKRKREYKKWKKKSNAEMEEMEQMLNEMRNGII